MKIIMPNVPTPQAQCDTLKKIEFGCCKLVRLGRKRCVEAAFDTAENRPQSCTNLDVENSMDDENSPCAAPEEEVAV